MIFAVWLPLVMPLLAVPTARRLAESLPPRAAAWLLAGCVAALASCTAAALGLLTAARGDCGCRLVAAFRPPGAGAAGRDDAVVTVPAAPVAGALLACCAFAVARRALRHRAELRAARRAADAHGLAGDLCVLPEAAPDAYALPGRPGRVVVTAGMLRALPPAEREALFAHERAHLAGRHHLFLLAAELAAVCHPLLRELRSPLAYALERWADESAAARVGDRQVTARAIGRAALAARTHAAAPRPSAAPAATTGPVPRRVAALLGSDRAADRPRGRSLPGGRRLIAATLLACVAFSAAGAVDAAADLHQTVETAQGEQPGR
ncbi:M56 family metallopeptidase [Streptomyces sp. 769]|uniref:M56 family metallopeptidase n=1 Tax=Streptomyces sp. 769 TaxID=1262452 RepID=UPI00057DABAF|nr:M56 family metallopeptidase [Streptomyces sp. 769]AJC55873.1 putative integral membrane protein [Streptomyces sp. 769]